MHAASGLHISDSYPRYTTLQNFKLGIRGRLPRVWWCGSALLVACSASQSAQAVTATPLTVSGCGVHSARQKLQAPRSLPPQGPQHTQQHQAPAQPAPLWSPQHVASISLSIQFTRRISLCRSPAAPRGGAGLQTGTGVTQPPRLDSWMCPCVLQCLTCQ
jgi:hypothetical protein